MAIEKFFNNAGSQQVRHNYALDPLRRVNLADPQELYDPLRPFAGWCALGRFAARRFAAHRQQRRARRAQIRAGAWANRSLRDLAGLRVEIELEVGRAKDALGAVIDEGRLQTHDYMQRCGASGAHLPVFDTQPAKTWDERIYRRPPSGQLTLWGC